MNLWQNPVTTRRFKPWRIIIQFSRKCWNLSRDMSLSLWQTSIIASAGSATVWSQAAQDDALDSVCGHGHRSIIRLPQPSGCGQQSHGSSPQVLPPRYPLREPVVLVQSQRVSTLPVVWNVLREATRPLSSPCAEARLLSLPKHRCWACRSTGSKINSTHWMPQQLTCVSGCFPRPNSVPCFGGLSNHASAGSATMLRRAQQPPRAPSSFMLGWITRVCCRRS